MKRIATSRLEGHKKLFTIVGVGLLLVVFMSSYIFASYTAWHGSRQATTMKVDELVRLDEAVLYDKSISVQDRQSKLAAISVFSPDGLCDISWMYQWQATLLDTVKRQQGDCQSTKATFAAVQTDALRLQEYQDDEQKLVGELQRLKIEQKILKSDQYNTVAKTVEQTNDSIATLSLKTKQGERLQTLILEKLKTINGSWSDLLNADKKEDKAEYEESIKDMAAAYKQLGGVTKQSDRNYEVLLDDLQKSHQKLAT